MFPCRFLSMLNSDRFFDAINVNVFQGQAAVPVPENVLVRTFREGSAVKAAVSWMYPSIAGHTHQFRFDLSERLLPLIIKKRKETGTFANLLKRAC